LESLVPKPLSKFLTDIFLSNGQCCQFVFQQIKLLTSIIVPLIVCILLEQIVGLELIQDGVIKIVQFHIWWKCVQLLMALYQKVLWHIRKNKISFLAHYDISQLWLCLWKRRYRGNCDFCFLLNSNDYGNCKDEVFWNFEAKRAIKDSSVVKYATIFYW